MNHEEMTELLLQSLEHERGGVQVYETALRCVQNDDLRTEWEEYLEQTRNHVQVLETVCERLGIDTDQLTPGCEVVRHLGSALVQAMTKLPFRPHESATPVPRPFGAATTT